MDLEEFFESLDLDTIRRFIADRRQEDNYLDFKRLSDNPMNKDDKGTFAKALSGFANADGGIIVWGVDARKNQDGIDCACDEALIQNLPKFMSHLQSFTGEFVSPIVDGVRSKSIPLPEDENSGFAATLIPRSESTPHMAKAGDGNFKYFKRSGDSFYPMEHYDLADMFGRRPHPKLEFLLSSPKIGSNTTLEKQVYFVIGIRNIGKGSAKYPFLHFEVNRPYNIDEYGLDGWHATGLQRLAQTSLRDSHMGDFGGGADIVIYPNIDFEVTRIKVQVKESNPDLPDLKLYYQITCDGNSLVEGTESYSGKALYQLAFPPKVTVDT